ncbi:MAG TPA: hypothetical protein PKH07_09995 [bacterium]|nr:hypothetical protein [bacterium]
MKRIILAAVLMLVVSPAFGQLAGISVDWAKTMTMEGAVSSVAYNYATDHFLVCQYNAPVGKKVAIVNQAGDTILGYLNETGLTFGTLNVFAICVGSDGVIFGGGNPDPDGAGTLEDRYLYRWANESAVPTQFNLGQADSANAANDFGMIFPRAMDVYGTGVNTVVASSGDNSYDVSILTTTDGVNFTFAYRTNADNATDAATQIKQGVALTSDPAEIYGVKADGAGQVVSIVKSVTDTWFAKSGFVPANSYGVPPAGFGAAALIDYSEAQNAVFVIGYSQTDDWLTALDGTTGATLFQTQIGQNVSTYGYGTMSVNDAQLGGYFGSRALGTNLALFGKFSYTTLATPTNTPTETPTFTPEATPTKSSGVKEFEVYE